MIHQDVILCGRIADTVLIREVFLIQSVVYREVSLHSIYDSTSTHDYDLYLICFCHVVMNWCNSVNVTCQIYFSVCVLVLTLTFVCWTINATNAYMYIK